MFSRFVNAREVCALKQPFRLQTWRSLSKKKQTMDFKIGEQTKMKLDNIDAKPRNIRFYSWWSTPTGQKVAGIMMVGASFVAAIYQIAPHTFMLNFVRNYYQHLSDGYPTPISADSERILKEVVSDMNLSKEERDSLHFFVLSVFDTSGWGEMGSKALIGFPQYFQYTAETQVPLSRMRFGNKGSEQVKFLSPAELESEQAKNLIKSLIISDEAKKFAVAREILKVSSAPQYMRAVTSSCTILLALFLSRIVNRRLNLFRKAPLFRGLNYSTMLLSGTALYFVSKDASNRRIQGSLDHQTSSLSKEYARGGVEYYNKILERHIAQRDLCLGGKELYNLHGEEVYEYVRRRNKLFRERRDICDKALQEFSKDSN